MKVSNTSESGGPGFSVRVPEAVGVHSGRVVAEGTFQPMIASKDLAKNFAEIAGSPADNFPLSTRVFDLDLRPRDEVLVCTVGTRLPLVIRRNAEVIVNFDLRETEVFNFSDSKRPTYTRIPGFNIHAVPEAIRRPVSNLVESLRAPNRFDRQDRYRQLPLTQFQLVVLLLNTILAGGSPERLRTFHWPGGKRAVFVPLHDVDTDGFLRRRERDPLLRIEQRHGIRSTWFIPTKFINSGRYPIDFLLETGNEAGWHGHRHDHRDHIKPFADRAVTAFANSCLQDLAAFPIGMRLPKLLRSNYLFELLERFCPALCYDTSFQQGIAPYYLWLNGRQSTILEIPTTVPTDISVYNSLRGLPRARRAEAILQAQIARTQQLTEAGAVISIVTHPEKTLSERPDFLDAYDQYLSYICGRSDVWITTAGELFKYWTRDNPISASHAA
jgi:peptidoglycan-N-acetylglucosamine deacetylase